MKIYIPTRGRAGRVTTGTLSRIPACLWRDVCVVVHFEELEAYTEAINTGFPGYPDLQIIGFDYDSIAEKRQRIAEHADAGGVSRMVMVDDDLQILIRRSPDDWRHRRATDHEVITMFHRITEGLDTYAQVAISGREGNNRVGIGDHSDLIMENARCMRITAFRTDMYLSCELNRMPFMEDFDVTLQLLRRGHKNAVYHYYMSGQKMMNSPGGCNFARTVAKHNECAEQLAALHPGLVKVYLKRNKSDQNGFGARKEVRVQWKKAYRQGTEHA